MQGVDVFVARQPIFDRSRRVYGYELLFRANQRDNTFDNSDATSATLQVISNSLFALGLEDILGGRKGFFNFGRALIVNGWRTMLPKHSTVIELLETVEPDSEVVEACRKLRAEGYAIALDDFVLRPGYEALIGMASFVKIDIRATPRLQATGLIADYGARGIRMLAEKVETYEEFQWTREAGFDYFQGYFFARPEVLKGRQISASKITCLRLIQEATKPDLDFDRLEELIGEDVSFSYKLVRYVNSALFFRKTSIHSIGQALVTLGEGEIRHWIAVAALPRMAEDKPGELVRHAILRARFCEIVAQVTETQSADRAFLVGLFSQLDALLDRPLETALSEVNLAPAITNVLLGTATPSDELSRIYNIVRRYEQGDWDAVEADAHLLGVPSALVGQSYLEAMRWANRAMHI